jgi:GGDEF domain-containing protein
MTQEKDIHFWATLQSDYAAWLTQILLSSLYDSAADRKEIIFPELLDSKTESGLKIPSRILDSQGILHELAKKIMNAEAKPSKDVMELFLVTFENFQASLQKLEHGQLMADFGIDELTGMQTQEKMIPELQRELERRSRRGQPFCFVISRIDGEENRKNTANILLASKAVLKTIRSFDDAYIIAEGEFISSLKHSDNNGGLKFVARLNYILRENTDIHFAMSSIVAEPQPRDSIPQLIENVRKELDTISQYEEGLAEEYKEVSPLAIYLKSLKEKPE